MMRLRLRVVLVEPMYESKVGSVPSVMKNFAASFQAAHSLNTSPRRKYRVKRDNVVSSHETEIEDESACQKREL